MAQLVIDIPDELARELEAEAATQHASVSDVAAERLAAGSAPVRRGSPAALLRILSGPPVSEDAMEEFLEVLRSQEPPEKREILYPRRK